LQEHRPHRRVPVRSTSVATDGHANSDAHLDRSPNVHAYRDSDTDAYIDQYTHGDANQHAGARQHVHPNAHVYINRDRDSNSNCDADARAAAGADRGRRGDNGQPDPCTVHSDADANRDRDAEPNSHGHGNSATDGYALAHVHSVPNANSDPGSDGRCNKGSSAGWNRIRLQSTRRTGSRGRPLLGWHDAHGWPVLRV